MGNINIITCILYSLEIDIDVYDNIEQVKPLISIKRTQAKENFHFYIQNGLILKCFILLIRNK